ncbi:hypothetical protein NQZ68_038377 [Dissostichus eleginoides]|nr:hypothetical protein NQZ68_038377 [Dissostichus eleginoides]
MDRRTNQNQRGNPRPFDHGAVADRAYRQIHCRNGWIYGLDEFHMALGEERAGFGHRMRKEKDNVKRLEDILSNRNSGFDQDNKRLFDIIQYRVADISRLKEQMEAAESQHKQQLDDMVAQQQKLSDQNNEGNLVTFNLLQRREQELLQCEEKFTKNLAEKHDIWESEKLQMEKKYEEVTQEKNDLDRKILSRDTEFQQLEATLKQVEQQKNYLAKKNKSWETDVKQLKDQMREQEEMFSKDLAQNQESCEAKVNLVEIKLIEVTQEKDDLAQKQLSREKELKEVQAELKMAEDEKKDSAKKNLSLEKEVQLKERQVKQLENDLDEQKKMFYKDLAQNQESWETKVHLTETRWKQVEEQRDDLAQGQLSWEAKEEQMEEEKKLLEDLCLHMKNKSRGFFSRRRDTEDRDVALQKMKSKMLEKEMRKKSKREEAEGRNSASKETEKMEAGRFYYLIHPSKLTYDEAVQACQKDDAQIAKVGQMYAAWKLLGFDRCDAGWLADGSVRYPISNPRRRCSPTETAVRFSGFPDKKHKLYGVYCFKGHN